MSKTPVSLGDDEPFGTSPGSSNCSSKQRFQRSTSVKKGTRALQRSPGLWIVFLPDPADPERTFRAPVLTISLYYFHPCFDNSATVALPPMTVRIQRVCIRLNNRFYLTLPRTAPTGKRQGHEYLWLLHHQQW